MNVKSLDNISEDLFNKIRGRFPSVTIGDENGEITNEPSQARFFDFDFKEAGKNLGKVSIAVSEESVSVTYTNDFVENEDQFTKDRWYDFLKEIRAFAKKRLLKFDTRDITKSNLNKRDYQFLAQNTGGDVPMSESKLYGTSKVSYQDIGSARLNIRHKKAVNPELAASRTQNIDKVYIESPEGERFKYPYRHLAGARAMARHVSEGGKPYDEFGTHITGLSEELSKIRKFKNYINRSSVMAEGLQEYIDIIESRIQEVKTRLHRIQKPTTYTEEFEGYESPVFEEVPEDVAENWIDQLTIKQFNEELKDVFPYIYNLVKEGTKAQDLSFEDIVGEDEDPCWKGYKQVGMKKKGGKEVPNCVPEEQQLEDAFEEMMGQFSEEKKKGVDGKACWKGYRYAGREQKADGTYKDKCVKVEGIDMLDLDTFFEARGDAPSGDRITTDENPLVTSYDDEFDQGKPGMSGHMNLKTYMNIIGISEKYQDMLAKAVLDAGVGKKISVPDEAKADYDAEREEEGLKPRALWIELSQHHKAEKASDNATEGNKFTKALAKARANNDDEMEVDGEKIPVTEFILSYFDKETGQFPKGETAVLTMVEKEYGDNYIEPAKKFIEAINNRVAEVMGYKDADVEESGLQYHIGKKKYGKEGMAKLAQAGREGASEEELGRIKDEYARESEDLRKLAGL